MGRQNGVVFSIISTIFATIFFLWLAVFLAPIFDPSGLSGTLNNFNNAKLHPFDLKWCDNTPKFIIFFLFFEFILGAYMVVIGARNTRSGEEQGSARLKSPVMINKYLSDKDFFKNRILSEKVKISITGKKAPISLNTLVVGGMGAGKSWKMVGPNLLQANTSFVATDPSRELVEDYGYFLKMQGYKVKVLDCINLERSTRYNFFNYIASEDDILRIVNAIFQSTVSKEKRGGSNSDPMWENMAQDYLVALIALIYYRGKKEEQNIETIIWLMNEDFLLDAQGRRERTCVMDMFDKLEEDIPGNLATSAYRSATDGDVVTIRGVKSTLRGRVGKFLLPSIQNLMSDDEMEFDKIGSEKTALFLCVPTEDSSFNFLVSLVYCQLIPILYRQARNSPGRHLPIPLQFIMDEMTNFVLPDEHIQNLTTARKHWMSYMMFIQELGQLKQQFKEEDETLIGTCNTVVYLGRSGNKTNKYFSEWMGEETVYSASQNTSYGAKGSHSKNVSPQKRAVYFPDELDTKILPDECIIYTAGKGFCKDNKFSPLKHPNYKYAAGGSEGRIFDYGGEGLKRLVVKPAITTAQKTAKPDIIVDISGAYKSVINKLFDISVIE